MSTPRGFLSLPLELVCFIFEYLSPHTCFQLSLVSRYSSRVFTCNVGKLLDHTIEGWGCLLFRCPRCKVVYRGKDASMAILYHYELQGIRPLLSEELQKVCRRCRRGIKILNANLLRSIFQRYVSDNESSSDSEKDIPKVDLARKGICRYECTYPPGNKDVKYMRDVVDRILCMD
jgi:hypothetical protein